MAEYRKPNPEIPPPASYIGPSVDEILAMRNEYLMPNHLLYYKNPIAIVAGNMQYVYDTEGKQYLDAIAGVVTISVGHCNARVLEKTIQQMELLQPPRCSNSPKTVVCSSVKAACMATCCASNHRCA